MLTIGRTHSWNCQGLSRRELLQVGGLGALGLSLPHALHAESSRGAKPRPETSCIFIYLEGGPSQLETFDPKPNAPNDVRGPYGAIATKVPGLHVCELLPAMSQRMEQCALIRSLTGFSGGHTA